MAGLEGGARAKVEAAIRNGRNKPDEAHDHRWSVRRARPGDRDGCPGRQEDRSSSSTAPRTSGRSPKPGSSGKASCRIMICSSNIRTGGRRRPAARHGRPGRGGRRRDHGQRRRSQKPDRRPQHGRQAGGAVHHRFGCAAVEAGRLYRLLQHRPRQGGRQADAQGAAKRRQVHRLRRAAGPTMPASASRASRTRSRARRSISSTSAATTSTRRGPSATSRMRWLPTRTSTAWSASTPTTRRGSTRC